MKNTYQTGKIYCLTNEGGKKYIGSTIKTLNNRLSGHRHDFKRYKDNRFHYISCFDIMEDPTYRIILLEEFPCNNRTELLIREGQYQKDMECVNRHINKQNSNEMLSY